METALCISYAQIVDGAAECVYCDSPAKVTVSTGADPDPEPVCWTHARELLDASAATMDRIFA